MGHLRLLQDRFAPSRAMGTIPWRGMGAREKALLSGCSSNPNSPFAASFFFSAKGKSIWLASRPQSAGCLSCFRICRLYGTRVRGGWVSRHSPQRRQIQSAPPVHPILDHNLVSCAVQPQLRLTHLELIFSSPFAHAAPVKRLPPTTPANRERNGTWAH